MLRTAGLVGFTLLLSSSLCVAQSASDPDLLACAKAPNLSKLITACTTFVNKTSDQMLKAMAFYLRSTANFRTSKSEKAIANINRAIELDSSVMDFHLAKARLLQSAGKLHGAEYIYDAILQKLPNHVPSLLGKIHVLAKRDHPR